MNWLVVALLNFVLAFGDSTVYIIRHGEKKTPIGCLNGAGEARAAALVDIFNGESSPEHETFTTPKAIFANNYDDHIDCERCTQTVTPIATALALPLNNSYGYNKKLGGNQGAATAIKGALKITGGPVLVAWEHINIQYLTADLGVDKAKIPSWANADYDSVYVLTFDSSQALTSFHHAAENYTNATL
jgi:hypothetical protein